MKKIKQAEPVYGRGLIDSLDRPLFNDIILYCAPEAWEIVKPQFPKQPRQVVVPVTMEQNALELQIREMPVCDFVFGIGGGSACDAAKMYSYLNDIPLILVPSILSVDAPFTKSIGVRVDHKVRYVGEVFPEHLLIDFDLLQKAPPRLNRAGVGDILSICTALYDWQLAADHKGEPIDSGIARQSRNLLHQMFENTEAIREVTEQGLRLLCDLYYGEVNLCEQFGNSRPEEGSEHYFAYCLESMTGEKYIHGELIALSVLITSLYQEQPVEPIIRFLVETGVDFIPSKIGVTLEQIEQTLVALPKYLEEESQLLYGIFHHKGMTEKGMLKIIDRLAGLISLPL